TNHLPCSFLFSALSLFYCCIRSPFFFFHAPPSTEISPLSLHDALPISGPLGSARPSRHCRDACPGRCRSAKWSRLPGGWWPTPRSEEHTSELQSRENLVCRLLLEKKKKSERHTPIISRRKYKATSLQEM